VQSPQREKELILAKRFIDTNLFSDEWFFDLSKDGKLAWIYYITNCNHAGIFEKSFKVASFETGIKDFATVTKELSNRLVSLENNKFFIPKFITFQYPKGLSHTVKAQQSVIDLLQKYNIDLNSCLTVSEELGNSYLTPQDTDKDTDKDKVKDIDTDISNAEIKNSEDIIFLDDYFFIKNNDFELFITQYGKKVFDMLLLRIQSWREDQPKKKITPNVYRRFLTWVTDEKYERFIQPTKITHETIIDKVWRICGSDLDFYLEYPDIHEKPEGLTDEDITAYKQAKGIV
jgi:hypothetical protein